MKKILKKALKKHSKKLYKEVKKTSTKKVLKLLTKLVKTNKIKDPNERLREYNDYLKDKDFFKLDDFIKEHQKTDYEISTRERQKQGYTSCGPYNSCR